MEGRFVGVEPVALYRQFTPLLAEREGIEVPEIFDGRGESLPFANDTFDVVLCYSAHQYMDVRPSLKEMARVLRPGGQLQIVGGSLGTYAKHAVHYAIRHRRLGALKSNVLTIANTMSYCFAGRRAYVPGGAAATTAPIYPPVSFMNAWLGKAGLNVRRDLFRAVGGEKCFVAEKIVASAQRSGPSA
jgi:SAM-dependent methyltransferase